MRISVCVATYNGGRYVKEQLESILSQLGEEDEVVVSDDGSTDNTIFVIKELNDSRIKLYMNEGRHGVVGNFENALMHSVGDVIFLADQDDVWMPHKVTSVMPKFESYDWVVHNASMVDSRLSPLGVDFFALRNTRHGFWNNIWKMRYLGCTMAFKRKTLRYILPFPKKILWHDMWAASILHSKYKGVLISEPLIWYRRHGENASPSGEDSGWSWTFRIKYRLYILIYAFGRICK